MKFTFVVGYIVGTIMFGLAMFQLHNFFLPIIGLLAFIWAELTVLTGGKDAPRKTK